MFPNWIIAGAPKAGTSSLFRWLTDHPDVTGPLEKETYYFVDPGTHMFRSQRNFYEGGLAGYSKLFDSCDRSSKIIIESTPGYVYSKTALRELPALPSAPRFIFVLREPVAQLRSLFTYFQQNWNWIPRDMSFAEFVAAAETKSHEFKGNELAANALSNVWYPEHLRRWRDAVGSERMFILLFEDLIGDTAQTMNRVSGWMGIDPSFYTDYDFEPENQTYLARNGALQDLNVLIRGRLPRGQVYNAVRRLYRAINTKKPPRRNEDLEAEGRLAARYVDMLPELETEYCLDLTGWRRGRTDLSAGKLQGTPSSQSFRSPETGIPLGLAAE